MVKEHELPIVLLSHTYDWLMKIVILVSLVAIRSSKISNTFNYLDCRIRKHCFRTKTPDLEYKNTISKVTF
jgi:hypothetical protein